MKRIFILFSLYLLYSCTQGPIGINSQIEQENEKEITSFGFIQADNPSLEQDYECNINGLTITVTLPAATEVTALIADFTFSGLKVTVKSKIQTSGETPNDFTDPVIYTVTALNYTTIDYTVFVDFADSPETEKDLIEFKFNQALNPGLPMDYTCIISGTDVTVIMPIGTDVTGLIAEYVTTGVNVTISGVPQTSGVTSNDFSSPVVYMVHAVNTSTKEYTVTISLLDTAKEITAFAFNQAANPGLNDDYPCSISGSLISVTLPVGTDVTALIADFITTGANVSVGGFPQTSGVTANDFSGVVTYTVSAEDSSTKDYVAYIDLAATLVTAAPVLNPGDTSFVTSIAVTISTSTENAGIIYTTDGSAPTGINGTQAFSPVLVNLTDTTTIRAIAVKTGWSDSSEAQGTYTEIVADSIVSGTIQAAIDAANNDDIIFIPAGTYNENLTINKPLTLIGEQTYPYHQTIIDSVAADTAVIRLTSGGTSPVNRVIIKNLKLTGGIDGATDYGTGIALDIASYVTIENITITGNEDHGIHINAAGTAEDIIIRDCTISNNGIHGIRIAGVTTAIDILISHCTMEWNGSAALMIYSADSSSSIAVTDCSFSSNGIGLHTLGDIIVSGYTGDIAFSDINITSNGCESGMRISGNSSIPNAGFMNFSNITINGNQQQCGSYPSAAFTFTRYNDLSNVTFSNIVINSLAPQGMFFGTLTGTSLDLGTIYFNGTFYLYDICLGRHGNSGSYVKTSTNIDATQSLFLGAADDTEIENRIWHNTDDSELGTVTWTSP